MNNNYAAIATNRFAMGAKPGDLTKALADPKQWLMDQLVIPPFADTEPGSSEIIRGFYEFRRQQKNFKTNPMNKPVNKGNQIFAQLSSDAIKRAVRSDHSFSWRLLDFFSNHFSVSARGGMMKPLAPTLEREAIAPNLLGSFESMLLAVEQHPAMLVYLDNDKSVGPDTPAAKKNRG